MSSSSYGNSNITNKNNNNNNDKLSLSKRRKLQEESESVTKVVHAHDNEADSLELLDSIASLRKIIADEARNNKNGFPTPIPLVLRHQLFVILGFKEDTKTLVDKQLLEARNKGYVRMFRCGNTGRSDDLVIVLCSHYNELVRQMHAAAKVAFYQQKTCKNHEQQQQEEEEEEEARVRTLRKLEMDTLYVFLEKVIPNHSDLFIEKTKLQEIFHTHDKALNVDKCARVLIDVGLLQIKTDSINNELGKQIAFEFSVPNVFQFCQELREGRLDIVKKIKNAIPHRGEMLISKLSQPKKSSLSIKYHLHDLAGLKLIAILDSPVGGPKSFVKWVSHKS